MMPLIPALAGALLVAGVIGVIVGSHPTPVTPPAPRRRPRLLARAATVSRRTRILAGFGAAAGCVAWLLTGWWIAVILVPAALVGLPILLSPPASTARIDTLDALEEWTRSLSGVLTVGVGLEEAVRLTLRSTPDPIRPEVSTLVARLRAGYPTEQALRAFADDLDDPTGDLVASFLILGSRRRGQGLAAVLSDLADSVAADVRARRAVEADRNKPRSSARIVTAITIGALGVLALTGDYIAPYGTPLGQLLLALLLTAYIGLLVWMRSMTVGTGWPRMLGATARGRAR